MLSKNYHKVSVQISFFYYKNTLSTIKYIRQSKQKKMMF